MPFDDNNETLETPVDETPEANVIPAEEQPVLDVPAQEPVTAEASSASEQPDTTYAHAYKKSKKKKGWTTGKVIALVLAACIFGSLLGLCGAYFGIQLLPEGLRPGTTTMYQGDREPGQLNIENVNTGKLMTPAEVYAANVNATVNISASVTQTNHWGYAATGMALGTGFILTPDGYIATNYHVVKGGTSIKVTLFNDQVFDAHLMAYNEGKDIAILKINATGLPTVVLGDSDKIVVGEQIMTIGHPLGELTYSLTVGFVSGMGREVDFTEGKQIGLIQTDCAINSGNSGGAMFNAYGEAVAIVIGKTSGATSSGMYIDNIAYAIPINDLKVMLQQLVEKGYTSRAYLGVSFTDVDERMQFYGVPKGASISSVEQASPAAKGGLKAYDVVTAFNGQKIENKEDLVTAVDSCTPDQKVVVSIYRSGETLDLEITLGEKIVASEY